MIAIKRLQSIMWILVVAAGALTAYLISLRVATERNAVNHMIDQIRWTRSDIRYLEAEFGSRASMRQLAAWNQNDLRLYVPGPTQYLANERELANLDRIDPAGNGYAPPPVMTAMATQVPMLAQGDAPQATQPETAAAKPATAPKPVELALAAPVVAKKPQAKPADAAPARSTSSDFSLIRTASAAEPRPTAAKVELMDKARGADKFIKPAGQPDPAARKAARLALLDEKLLGGTGSKAKGEGKR